MAKFARHTEKDRHGRALSSRSFVSHPLEPELFKLVFSDIARLRYSSLHLPAQTSFKGKRVACARSHTLASLSLSNSAR